MSIKYSIEWRNPPDDPYKHATLGRARMLAVVGKFVLTGWNFRTRKRGEDFGNTWIGRTQTINRVKNRTAFNDAGYRIFIQRKADNRVMSIHKMEVADPVPNLGCAPEIERIHAELVARFTAAGVPSGGRYFCRFVDGTRLVSHHGYIGPDWKGAAEDIFSVPDNMSALRVRADFIVNETKAGRLHADRVIVGNDSWTPGGGWESYGGEYHYHVHYEVSDGHPCSP